MSYFKPLNLFIFRTSVILLSYLNNYLVSKCLIIYICLTMKTERILTLLKDVIVQV